MVIFGGLIHCGVVAIRAQETTLGHSVENAPKQEKE